MAGDTRNARPRNVLAVAIFIIITLFAAFQEGYLPLISGPFWLVLIAGFAIAMWLALSISPQRLMALILGIFILEYIKETIGNRSGMWQYHGVNNSYNFGVWAWVLAGLVAYALSTRIVIRQLRKLAPALPRWWNLFNPAILLLIFLLIPLTLGNYWPGAGGLFWVFYLILLGAGVVTALRMDFSVFLGIVISTWIVSNPSEYMGSVSSQVWTFTHNPDYPPFFLLMGCWPLEILAQYSLSAYLANEPLDKDTF